VLFTAEAWPGLADGSITLTQVEPYRKIDWVFGVEWQRVGNP